MTRTTSIKQDFKHGATLFFYQLQKCRTPLIVFAVIAAFCVTVIFALTVTTAQAQNSYAELPYLSAQAATETGISLFQTLSALLVFFLTCVFTIIYTLRVFSYLHNKRKADWINPLPVKSGVLFLSKALAAFVAAVVPALVILGVVCLISVCFGVSVNSEILQLFARIPLGSIACIALYGLMAVCCGSSANTVLCFLAICFSYPLSVGLVKGMLLSFFYGIPMNAQSNHFIWKALNPLSAYDGVNVIYWLVFTAVCFVLAVLLLRRRKAERAQTGFAFNLPCYVVEMLLSFIAGMLLGVLFGSLKMLAAPFGGFVFGFVLGGGTVFFIAHVILFKGFAKMLKSLISFGAVCAAAIGFTAICCFASPAYVGALPERDSIKSAGYIEYTYDMAAFPPLSNKKQLTRDSAGDFTDENAIDRIYSEQQRLVTAFQKRGMEKKFRSVMAQSFTQLFSSASGYSLELTESFAYTLRDGGTVMRIYDPALLSPTVIDYMAGDYDYTDDYGTFTDMTAITSTPVYLKKYDPLGRLAAKDVQDISVTVSAYGYYNDFLLDGSSRADMEKLFSAFQEDYLEHGVQEEYSSNYIELTFGYSSAMPRSGVTALSLLRSGVTPSVPGGNSFALVPASYERTLAALKEIGILTADGKGNPNSPYHANSY